MVSETKRVLVTGGGGFIGSHLTARLLSAGHDVLVVDTFCSSTRANLAALERHPRLQVRCHDVIDPLYVEVDQIYHLACPASPVHYQRDPVHTLRTCVYGATNMLGLARRTGAPDLAVVDLGGLRRPRRTSPGRELLGHVNPIGLRSCYDEGKRCAEALFFSYRLQHDLAVKVARIFNTYGPGMRPDDGRVVSNFIVDAVTGQATQGLRRRLTDAVVLLRRRPR